MRAQRKLAILDAIRRGLGRDKAIAVDTGIPLTGDLGVRALRRVLREDGLIEPVPAPPESNYPIAGWRVVE